MSEEKSISAAEAKKPEKVEVKAKKSGKKYFRANRLAGTKFKMNEPENGNPVLIKYVGFTVVDKNVNGYSEPKGYLATDDPVVIKHCEKLGYVDEISESEFKNRK